MLRITDFSLTMKYVSPSRNQSLSRQVTDMLCPAQQGAEMIEAPAFSIAVFPFLKTSAPVAIGGYTFRSTENVNDLPPDQLAAISELAEMLFVQDDLRVKSAAFAVLPPIESHSGDQKLVHLTHLRDVVAYFYAAPHEILGDVFLGPEEATLLLLSPARVSVFLTRPEHHTVPVVSMAKQTPDQFHNVRGYNGLYNFKHAFWVEPGSRIYGPKPHMVLNISQDMAADFGYHIADRPDYRLLFDLLNTPDNPTSLRIYSALRWFNAANERAADQSQSLLNLAIAFETLLKLPESAKTDRLVDAISLLLGRTDRLDEWAEQFYDARSKVVHEGGVSDAYFYATGTKDRKISGIFGSLLLYGRQIFQLCVGTVLVGIDLAKRADLQEKFVTNNERYQSICKCLENYQVKPQEKLLSIAAIVRALGRYRFIASGLEFSSMTASARLACATLLACGHTFPPDLNDAIRLCAEIKREDSELRRLSTVQVLKSAFEKVELAALPPEARVVRDLADLVWMAVFQRYYWLKDRENGELT